jgi:hypothetical protein
MYDIDDPHTKRDRALLRKRAGIIRDLKAEVDKLTAQLRAANILLSVHKPDDGHTYTRQ